MLSQALMFLLHRRVSDIGARIDRLVVRFQAGRLWRCARRPVVSTKVAVVDDQARPEQASVWPRRFGWLVWRAGYQAAGYGSQLRAILATPEMVALLSAAPEAGRILRPLCRMLAVETSLLRPRPLGVVAAEAGACEDAVVVVRKRARVARVAVDLGRVPLPRGVMAAARRQGVWRGG